MSVDPQTHIGSVSLKVADLKRSEQFYTDVLGMHVQGRGDGKLSLGGQDGPRLLELIEIPGAMPRPRRSTGLYHFAILTPKREALGLSLRRLVETGYPLHGAADHLVSEALYLDDPDHNGIEIYRDRPKNEWHFDGNAVRMANEPVDLESLLKDAGDQDSHGLQRGTTMGHIHLHVRDLDEAEGFYCGVLGFDVMLRWPPSALFISAGGYHHHIGLNTWAGVGAPPPPEDAAGLKRFQIVLPNSAAKDQVLARLKENGTNVEDQEGGMAFHDPSQNGICLVVSA